MNDQHLLTPSAVTLPGTHCKGGGYRLIRKPVSYHSLRFPSQSGFHRFSPGCGNTHNTAAASMHGYLTITSIDYVVPCRGNRMVTLQQPLRRLPDAVGTGACDRIVSDP